MSNQVQCSHSRVIRVLDQTGVGHTSEHWECPDCLTRFWPEYIDMHRKRLRTTIAIAAMQGLIVNAPEGASGGQLCDNAIKFADYLLHSLEKQ